MDRFWQNLRIGARGLRRAPGFTSVVVVTIALGIGANVAIFSVVRAVLLEPLPYPEADRLVAIWEWNLPRDRRTNVANPGNFRAWREGARSFGGMSAVALERPVTMDAGGQPDEVMLQPASPDFFEVLGLEAALGRTFVAEERDGTGREALLSDAYWRERFGADPGVVGTTLRLNGSPAVVVGVLPPEYVIFGESTDVWMSFRFDAFDQTNTGRGIMVVGRLAEGATLEGARAELESVARVLEQEFPELNAGWSVNPVPLKEQVVGDVRQALWILWGAVGLLLLVAGANVANLFLVRATRRQGEMALRASLGASGRALAEQLVIETVLVAGLGAALGTALAHAATRWMAGGMLEAFRLPRMDGAGVDGVVLAFAAVLTAGTALVFGLLPALEAVRASPARTLAAEARGSSRRSGAWRSALVVTEIAMSAVLLSGAMLFARSFAALVAEEPGIEPGGVLVGRVSLSADGYPDAGSRRRFFTELLGRLADRPGVDAAGAVSFLPLDGFGAATSYWPVDRPVPDPEDRPVADVRHVAGDYFAAMGIELLRGRPFDARDRAESSRVVVVNRALAEAHWPGRSPLGERLVVHWDDEVPWEIVGVVEDVRLQELGSPPRATVYMTYEQSASFPWLHVTMRGGGPLDALAGTLRDELRRLDAGLPLGSVRAMEDVLSRSVARQRTTSLLMLVFAGLATTLAAVGLYGVLSYMVSQRIREFGVRVALGARTADVVALVVRQATVLALTGVLAGLAGAAALGGLAESVLYGVRPTDGLSLVSAGLALGVVATVACALPAWKAARTAPAEALRTD